MVNGISRYNKPRIANEAQKVSQPWFEKNEHGQAVMRSVAKPAVLSVDNAVTYFEAVQIDPSKDQWTIKEHYLSSETGEFIDNENDLAVIGQHMTHIRRCNFDAALLHITDFETSVPKDAKYEEAVESLGKRHYIYAAEGTGDWWFDVNNNAVSIEEDPELTRITNSNKLRAARRAEDARKRVSNPEELLRSKNAVILKESFLPAIRPIETGNFLTRIFDSEKRAVYKLQKAVKEAVDVNDFKTYLSLLKQAEPAHISLFPPEHVAKFLDLSENDKICVSKAFTTDRMWEYSYKKGPLDLEDKTTLLLEASKFDHLARALGNYKIHLQDDWLKNMSTLPELYMDKAMKLYLEAPESELKTEFFSTNMMRMLCTHIAETKSPRILPEHKGKELIRFIEMINNRADHENILFSAKDTNEKGRDYSNLCFKLMRRLHTSLGDYRGISAYDMLGFYKNCAKNPKQREALSNFFVVHEQIFGSDPADSFYAITENSKSSNRTYFIARDEDKGFMPQQLVDYFYAQEKVSAMQELDAYLDSLATEGSPNYISFDNQYATSGNKAQRQLEIKEDGIETPKKIQLSETQNAHTNLAQPQQEDKALMAPPRKETKLSKWFNSMKIESARKLLFQDLKGGKFDYQPFKKLADELERPDAHEIFQDDLLFQIFEKGIVKNQENPKPIKYCLKFTDTRAFKDLIIGSPVIAGKFRTFINEFLIEKTRNPVSSYEASTAGLVKQIEETDFLEGFISEDTKRRMSAILIARDGSFGVLSHLELSSSIDFDDDFKDLIIEEAPQYSNENGVDRALRNYEEALPEIDRYYTERSASFDKDSHSSIFQIPNEGQTSIPQIESKTASSLISATSMDNTEIVKAPNAKLDVFEL
ncbi:MAG: hypothetical protein CMH28_03510 [Micavibrio sp.]|nr:hypothetical protein [Micavibrio sp.]